MLDMGQYSSHTQLINLTSCHHNQSRSERLVGSVPRSELKAVVEIHLTKALQYYQCEWSLGQARMVTARSLKCYIVLLRLLWGLVV